MSDLRNRLLKEIDEHTVYKEWETMCLFSIPPIIRDYSRRIVMQLPEISLKDVDINLSDTIGIYITTDLKFEIGTNGFSFDIFSRKQFNDYDYLNFEDNLAICLSEITEYYKYKK